MKDRLSPARRSENMRAIRSRDTSPEKAVRSLVHRLGYRFRLHRKDLPGKPDLTFPGRGKVLFVHGCFWHQHHACAEGRVPGSNQTYWAPKLARNVQRDAENLAALRDQGWDAMVVWECELKDGQRLKKRLTRFLGGALS